MKSKLIQEHNLMNSKPISNRVDKVQILSIFGDFHKVHVSNSVATWLAKIALRQSLFFRSALMASDAHSGNPPFCAKPKDFPLQVLIAHPAGLISHSPKALAHMRASCSRAKSQATAHAVSCSPVPPAHAPRPGRAPHCCASPSLPRSDVKSPSPSLVATVQVRITNPSHRSSSNVPNRLHQFIMPRFISEGSNDHHRVLHHDRLGGRLPLALFEDGTDEDDQESFRGMC
jgi:hypothetical protein